MIRRSYLLGIDAAPQRVLAIRVKNARQLAESRGGVAWLAANVIPETVEDEVYKEMAKQFGDQLRQNGVHADVAVLDAKALGGSPASRPGDSRAFGIGALAGASVAGVIALLWRRFA